jgi:hypothetical protein
MPLGLLGALGLAGFSLWAAKFRSLLIGIAFLVLVAGFVQIYRRPGACHTRSRVSLMMFWSAVVIVLLIAIFPQIVATLLAGWSYWCEETD